MSRTRQAAFLAFIIALMTVTVPAVALSDGSDADGVYKDYNLSGGNVISTSAGESLKLYIDLYCNTGSSAADGSLYVYMSAKVIDGEGANYSRISVSVTSDSDSTVSTGNVAVVEAPSNGKIRFTLNLSVDQYASHDTYTVEYTYTVRDLETSDSAVVFTNTGTQSIIVSSTLSNDGMFNKFLGIIPNNLDGALNSPWFTSIVTFIAWILIGFIASLISIPVLTFLASTKDNPERPKLKKTIFVQITIMFTVYAAVNALCVLGIDETLTADLRRWANIIYVVNIAIIAWRCYRTLIDRIVNHIKSKDVLSENLQDFESFRPLFLYIGEIVLAIFAVSVSLSLLGFDLTAIITSAGIVSLGITFGAQEVLKQFFAGLVMLSTRPFKKGDLIQLGGTSVVYRVRKINVMNTELENWDNSDVTVYPNNTLTSGAIKNITRDGLRYKVHMFMDVSYDSDIAKVRQLLLEVAYANPRVITDGSVDKPFTRVTGFEASNIQVRLTFWVDDFNDNGTITGDIRVAAWNKFAENGVDVDYDTISLRMAGNSAAD